MTIKRPPGATPVRYGVSERARVWAVARTETTPATAIAREPLSGAETASSLHRPGKIRRARRSASYIVALDAAGNASAVVPVTGLHMPAL